MVLSPVLVREIHTKDDPAFLDAMELYVESFPREERERVASFARKCDPLAPSHRTKGYRNHLIVAESEGQVVGMRSCAYDPEGGWGFFVYIVVDPSARKSGIGARLIEYATALLRLDALAMGSEVKAIFFECERVCDARTTEQEAERAARLAYFDRRGGKIVSGTYTQPALREGLDPVPLNLMAYPLQDGLERADMVRGFYDSFLGMGEDDPLVAAALRGVEDERPR